jgi:hypothetical protein
MKIVKAILGLGIVILLACWLSSHAEESNPGATTSTEWRDDEKNIIVVRELNRAYEQLPFSHEYEGVLDQPPVKLDWSTGPNLPMTWKGGVAGFFGDEIALVGGTWMPGYKNLAYAYNIKTKRYSAIPPPPFPKGPHALGESNTEYTQGVSDGDNLYLVSGRAAGRNVARLSRAADGSWKWEALPQLPDFGARGRWLGEVAAISGKWLLLISGLPAGRFIEGGREEDPPLPDFRLRLDDPKAQWQPMAPYPGGRRGGVSGAVVQSRFYVFGGNYPNKAMASIHANLIKEYGLLVIPYQGVPDYRDAYSYDPETNEWRRLRNLPFPMCSDSPAVVLQDRYILLMGNTQITQTTTHFRMGKTNLAGLVRMYKGKVGPAVKAGIEPYWRGYGDVILCYDVEKDNYSRVGAMLYGVGSVPWVTDGKKVYGFGGEPWTFWSDNPENVINNTENVLQIGTIQMRN